MALNRSGSSVCTPKLLKIGFGLMAICLLGYILGPPLYWHFREGLAAVGHTTSSSSVSCLPCKKCGCSAQSLPSIPKGLINSSFTDCAKHDPEIGEDTEKNFVELLSEELKLRESGASESQQRAEMQLLEAKKMISQYQKEADKCNSGMETCEEAREKAEASLVAQKKLTAMWKTRARQKGWKEGAGMSKTQSQSNIQTL